MNLGRRFLTSSITQLARLSLIPNEYSFTSSGITPELVGYDPTELDTVLKFVSEADLENYGATALPGEIGERTFEWSNDPAQTNTFNSEPLKDLDGNVITKAGWYDFTRRYDADGTSIGDGGEFIYANYIGGGDPSWQVDTDIRNFTEDGTIRIIGLRLRFTDNSFGDKDPTIGTVVDPFGTGGATGSEAELLSARAAIGCH